MKIARQIRFAMIKLVRFWKSRKAAFMADLKYALEPLNQQKATNKKQNTTSEKYPRHPPFGGDASIKNIPDSQPSDINSTGTPKHEYKSIDWWKKRLEIAGIIGGLAGIIFIAGQFWVAQSQLAEMQLQRRMDERAWVCISNPALALPYGTNHLGLTIKITNTGKTPAFFSTVTNIIKIVGGDFTNILSQGSIVQNFVCAPGETKIVEIDTFGPISSEQFGALQQKKLKCIFWMNIEYRDIFGQIRHTSRSYILNGKEDEMTPGQAMPDAGESIMD